MTDALVPSNRELAVAPETASTAVAAQAKAMVESRYVMAMRAPRNMDQVRQDLLRECRRPAFAHNKSAWYVKPIGNGVEGLGIRFVEVALRCMRNVLIESTMVYDDAEKEIHRVSVTDLESNVTYPMDVRVSRTVERSKPASDGSYVSVRTNSLGKQTYLVPAQEDDLLNKRAALISKAVRTLGLRIIPGDLQDEAEAIIKQIRLDREAQDPAAARKSIVDAFGEIGVPAADLTAYLGHAIDQCSPPELMQLRGLFSAIRDGEATWATVMENKMGEAKAAAEKVIASGKAPTTEQARAVLGGYDQTAFEKNLPAWGKTIAAGKKTPDQVIATIQTRNTLTDEQRAAIMALAAKPAVAVPIVAAPAGPLTNDQLTIIADKMEDAAMTDHDICKRFAVDALEKIPAAQYEAVLAFLANPMGGAA